MATLSACLWGIKRGNPIAEYLATTAVRALIVRAVLGLMLQES